MTNQNLHPPRFLGADEKLGYRFFFGTMVDPGLNRVEVSSFPDDLLLLYINKLREEWGKDVERHEFLRRHASLIDVSYASQVSQIDLHMHRVNGMSVVEAEKAARKMPVIIMRVYLPEAPAVEYRMRFEG